MSDTNMSKLKLLFGQYEHRFARNSVEEDKKLPPESLVQYNNPAEVSLATLRKKQSTPIPSLESKPSIEEQDLLNSLIRPRDWEVDGKRYMQTVSSLPPSRDDITNLQKLLDERLVARQARESGLCPIREELFNQCFDEIIRQVTIDCMERGVVLARVRDDRLKTIQSYKHLYEGSIPFSHQRQLAAEQGLSQLEDQIKELNARRAELDLKRKKQFLLNKKEAVEKGIKEKNLSNETRRKAEIEFLKYQSSHLESYTKQVNPKQA